MGMRTTLVLLLLVGALVAVLAFTGGGGGDDRGRIQVPVLGGRGLLEAVELRFDRGPGSEPVQLAREANAPFRIVEPIVDLASRARLLAMAQAFDSAMMAEAFPDTEPDAELLQQIGLDRPRATLTVAWPDGARMTLAIGSEGPLGSDTFLRRDGRVYRGGLALFTALQVNLEDLRERQVFANVPGTTREIAVDQRLDTGATERLRLVRDNAGFRLAEPIQSRTDAGAVQTFLRLLLALRIDQFAPSVVRFPPRDPDLLVVVDGTLGRETVRMWRTANNDLIGEVVERGISFASGDSQFGQIFVNAAGAMRARWLVPIEDLARELVRVVVEFPGPERPRLVMQRPNPETDFRMTEPLDVAMAPTPKAELIQAINNLRVLQFVPGAAAEARFGLQGDGVVVSVLGIQQREPTVIRLGADDRLGEVDVTYAIRTDEPGQVLAVPRPAAELLRRPWQGYVARTVLGVDVPVDRLELSRGGADAVFSRGEGRWRRVGDEQPRDWVGSLVDELRDLRSERVLSARRLELGAPDWTLRLCRLEGDVLAELVGWDRGPGQPMLVQAPHQPALVHELGEFLSDYLRRLWQ